MTHSDPDTDHDADTAELENGCRASTPAGDNLIADFARAEADGYAALVQAGGGRVAHDDRIGLCMADAGSPTPFGNLAHLTRPVPDTDTEQFVGSLRDFFGGNAGGPFLVFSPWPTVDLGRHGFHLAGHPPFMVRAYDIGGDAAPLAERLHIVEVATATQLEDFERTLCEAYPASEMLPFGSQRRMFGEGVLTTSWHLYVGYEDGTPVATAASYVTDQVVAVEAVSTRAECRGRGYGAAITGAATTAAGDRPAALVASDLGRGVYQDLGYLPILRYTLWVGMR